MIQLGTVALLLLLAMALFCMPQLEDDYGAWGWAAWAMVTTAVAFAACAAIRGWS